MSPLPSTTMESWLADLDDMLDSPELLDVESDKEEGEETSPSTSSDTSIEDGHTINQSHMFLSAVLDMLASVLANGDTKAQRTAFLLLTSSLVKYNILPAGIIDQQLAPVRHAYVNALQRLAITIRKRLRHQQFLLHQPIDALAHLVTPMKMHTTNNNSIFSSRYKTDFVELDMLGRGGFGMVVAARNLLDKCTYAIKRISFNEHQSVECLNVLREVQTLAVLNHPNIVRYHCAWCELDTRRSVEAIVGKSTSDGIRDDSMTCMELRRNASMPSMCCSKEKDEEEPCKCVTVRRHSSCEDVQSSGNGGHSVSSEQFVVHIQMELCDSTLRQYVNDRNARTTVDEGAEEGAIFSVVDVKHNVHMLRQLVEAVVYIHSMGVMHRDIKPSNVFLKHGDGTALRVVLGDFGLACTSELSNSTAPPTLPGVGTMTYSAPEQLCSAVYGNAVDIFSIGIIIYELYRPFKTHMEKVSNVMELRNSGVIDPLTIARFPRECDIIKRCVSPDRHHRPTAKCLMQLLLNPPHATPKQRMIDALQSQVATQDAEISRLKRRLHSVTNLVDESEVD